MRKIVCLACSVFLLCLWLVVSQNGHLQTETGIVKNYKFKFPFPVANAFTY